MPTIGARELADLIEAGRAPVLVDVRTPAERDIVSLPGGGIQVDVAQLRDGTGLPAVAGLDESAVFYCKSGARSAEAVRLVADATGVRARSLDGGVLGWIDQIDPSLPRY
ncbi:rhodanese-like domain-containing protein [Flexivirga sp.]|uniref:rhodanese-like domain-containing protein n=1 Tax=Flexivirga sp. TaxID=1962927 RepID=UPI003F7CD5A9